MVSGEVGQGGLRAPGSESWSMPRAGLPARSLCLGVSTRALRALLYLWGPGVPRAGRLHGLAPHCGLAEGRRCPVRPQLCACGGRTHEGGI